MAKSSFEGFLSPKPNKNGTNTGDATATAANLSLGVTAYAVGVKITGTGVNAKRQATNSATLDASGNLAVTGLAFAPSLFVVFQRATIINIDKFLQVGVNPAAIFDASWGTVKSTFFYVKSGTPTVFNNEVSIFTSNGFTSTTNAANLASVPVTWIAYE